jgi:8-oxo-dGTP diphosphatase
MRPGEDYIGVGIGGVAVDDQGRVFLAKRGPNAANERDMWEFPGGTLEYGERMRDALVREFREEYGVTIEVGELLTVVDHLLEDEQQHWVAPAYLCHITEGTPSICEPEECVEIGWFTIDTIPPEETLTLVTRENVKAYREYVKNKQQAMPKTTS